MLPPCKKANTISHSHFAAFVRDFLKQASIKVPDNGFVIKALSERFTEFKNKLEYLLKEPLGAKIDALEGERYRLWETIVDRLDENMLIKITDKAYILLQRRLKEEDALMQIPKYKATWELLVPGSRGENSRVFLTVGRSDGHFWNVDDMNNLIARLIDPLHSDNCSTAGIAGEVAALRIVERRLAESTAQFHDHSALQKVRQARHGVVVAMRVLNDLKLKKWRSVDAYDIYEDRLKQEEQIRRLEMFSPDQLTPGAFFRTLQNTVQKLVDEESLAEGRRAEIITRYEKFSGLIKQFQNHYLWEKFDKMEGEFYRSAVILLDAVSIHLPCLGAESKEIWEAHCRKDSYKAAMSLLEMIDSSPFKSFMYWTPDQLVGFPAMIAMVTEWERRENRKLLRACGVEEKFQAFCRLDAEVLDIAEEILDQAPAQSLLELRMVRYELSLMPEFRRRSM
ncbi:MAG: hypothetical protein ACLFSB_13875 [Chitinispirillaceae bacterium]